MEYFDRGCLKIYHQYIDVSIPLARGFKLLNKMINGKTKVCQVIQGIIVLYMDSIIPRTHINCLFFIGINLLTPLEAWLISCSWFQGIKA